MEDKDDHQRLMIVYRDWEVSMPEKKQFALMAGAGIGVISFDHAMFPVEGFGGGVHLAPCVRVLLLESGEKTAVVTFEMVNVPADLIGAVKTLVSAKTDVPIQNIWVHATHAITTPHAPDNPAKREYFGKAVMDAADFAAARAAASFCPAVIGIGIGDVYVNANRGLFIDGEWYYGLQSTMPSNKKMTVVSFRRLDGTGIGFLVSYGIKPTAIDNVEMKQGTRMISSDVPGVACRVMEETLGAPAMFCMAAAGDQIPRETAMFYRENAAGKAELTELSVQEGIEIAQRLGTEMGDAAIQIAESTRCVDIPQKICLADTFFTWANKGGDGEVSIAVRGMTIGDELALIGLKPEVNAVTERELWAASPYRNTLVMSFLDGDQKYMPDEQAYDLQTWEYKRSGTARGGAEKFIETATELLTDMKHGRAVRNTDTSSCTCITSAAPETVRLGGADWIVLAKQDGRLLVFSARVIGRRAYHASGGAITWEHSGIRAYLNGEFYEQFFSDNEKARITEVLIENRSNPQYGVAGGNATVDRVFLLSLSEVEKYLGSGVELLRGVDRETGEAVWWHLRSPGEAADIAASVNAIGLMDYHGVVGGITDPAGGIRPAMWIKEEEL